MFQKSVADDEQLKKRTPLQLNATGAVLSVHELLPRRHYPCAHSCGSRDTLSISIANLATSALTCSVLRVSLPCFSLFSHVTPSEESQESDEMSSTQCTLTPAISCIIGCNATRCKSTYRYLLPCAHSASGNGRWNKFIGCLPIAELTSCPSSCSGRKSMRSQSASQLRHERVKKKAINVPQQYPLSSEAMPQVEAYPADSCFHVLTVPVEMAVGMF